MSNLLASLLSTAGTLDADPGSHDRVPVRHRPRNSRSRIETLKTCSSGRESAQNFEIKALKDSR